jgi:hypothetical protein
MRIINTAAAFTAALAAVALSVPGTAHAIGGGNGVLTLCVNGPNGVAAKIFAAGTNDGGDDDSGSGDADSDRAEVGGANVESPLLTQGGTDCWTSPLIPGGGYAVTLSHANNEVRPNVPCNAGLPCPAKLIGWKIESSNINGTNARVRGPVAYVNLPDQAEDNTGNEGTTTVTAIFGFDPESDD